MQAVKISRYLYNVERDGVLLAQFRGDKAGRKAHAYIEKYKYKMTRADWYEVLHNKSSIPMRARCKPRTSAGCVNVPEKRAVVKEYTIKDREYLNKIVNKKQTLGGLHFFPEYYNSPKPWRRGGKVTGVVR